MNAPNSSKHFSDPWRWWKHHPSFWKPEPQASRDFFLYLQLPHFNKICVFFSSRLLLLLHLRVEEASYSKSPGER